jgi:hypothetical protein
VAQPLQQRVSPPPPSPARWCHATSSYSLGFQDRTAHFHASEMSTSALSSTLSLPVVFARQEPRKVPPHEEPDPRVVEALKPKRGVKVEGQGAKLLEFAGGSGCVA